MLLNIDNIIKYNCESVTSFKEIIRTIVFSSEVSCLLLIVRIEAKH